MLPNLILLSGVPATGKSYFGKWLQEKRGYLHIDAELRGELASHCLEQQWNAGFPSGDFTGFTSALGRPAVVNWGFPVARIDAVKGLVRAGFVPIWLNASDAAARVAYARRGTGDLSDLETQLQGIKSEWKNIQAVFAPRIFLTIKNNGARVSPEALCKKIEATV